jgi:flagellar biogenesis protein FliO
VDASTAVRLAGALAAIAGLLLGLRLALVAAGRARFGSPGRGRLLRIADSLGIGPGASLCVVEAGGRRLLLGVTQSRLSLLAELPAGDEGAPAADAGIVSLGAKLASDVGRENERARSSRYRR